MESVDPSERDRVDGNGPSGAWQWRCASSIGVAFTVVFITFGGAVGYTKIRPSDISSAPSPL